MDIARDGASVVACGFPALEKTEGGVKLQVSEGMLSKSAREREGLFKSRINVPIHQHEGRLDELAGKGKGFFLSDYILAVPPHVLLCLYLNIK